MRTRSVGTGSIRGLAKTSAVTLGSPFQDGPSVSGHGRMGESDNLRANDVAPNGCLRKRTSRFRLAVARSTSLSLWSNGLEKSYPATN